ncbi:unnamed protein product [marine sediment metagenome]|uniref:Uncharacterized protein n=1 Tax=marine sediment metagenome TaxID=412755 RepID=X1CMB7_9ZZZZ
MIFREVVLYRKVIGNLATINADVEQIKRLKLLLSSKYKFRA